MDTTGATTGSATTNSSPSSSPSAAKKNLKKPKYSRFSQQELPACKLILTPGLVVEIISRYDDHCIPQMYRKLAVEYIQSREIDETCTIYLTVPKNMKSPIYIYYQLDNLFQNHRGYVKSRSDAQLKSRSSEDETESCDPVGRSSHGAIVPCGLIAWSLFNDTYRFSVESNDLEVHKRNIAWKSDREHRFGSDVHPKNFQSGSPIGGANLSSSIPLSEQEDLMIWMRTAALPTFRKIYGRIEEDLQANDTIRVLIQNNYNSYSYGGTKRLILSTTTWIGGKNQFLGKAFLFVGSLSLMLAISFIVAYVFKPRPLGDPAYLSWNRHPAGRKM